MMNLKVEMFKRSKLLRKYIVKILFRQNNGKFENEYLKKLKRSQTRWKGKERQGPLEIEYYKSKTLELVNEKNLVLG